MKRVPNFFENFICLNVLASSVENAAGCYAAAKGHIVLGVLSKNCETDEAAIEDMKLIKRLCLLVLVLETQIKVKW